ncbi:hypothetical protein V5N11_027324 [Cardamine amara subsp. amara]|uniref:Uncharacterized protein n=1 Tax=Cardamine amara subsp. amara TaxID=228776 RepID=A0ABD1BHM5_CARAN
MFSQETKLTLELEILKENHELLHMDYEFLQEKLKLVEETYELFKLHLESKKKELEVKKAQLFEDCVRERNEKENCMKMFEEMKKTIDDKRNVEIDELRKISQELLLANKKEEEELEKNGEIFC